MNIRFELPGDIEKIRKVNHQAFGTETEANLVDALRNADVELISLVAEENAEVIGHILFSPVILGGDLKIAGLAPMAVLPDWQGKGAGTELVNTGLQACEEAGYEAVVVLGHPDYYHRFGFTAAANFGIKSEYDVPLEVFMLKELHKDALKGITGTVKYHQAFNEI